MILFNVWFRSYVLAFLVLSIFLAVFLPKIWLSTPVGFLPEIRISWLDRVQAWSLQRAAEKQEAAGLYDEAEYAWRAAISNNPGDAELCRRSLRSLLKAPTLDRKHLGPAFSRALWLMRLSSTNAVDVELTAGLLDRYEMYDYQLRLLGERTAALSARERALLAKAAFRTGQMTVFAEQWKQLSPQQKADPELALYEAAYGAGWGAPETAAGFRQRLAAARQDSARRSLANRVQLLVAARERDPGTFASALDDLAQARLDRVGDHVTYWLLLLNLGRRAEAERLAEEYPHAPSNPDEVRQLRLAYARLGRQETQWKFLAKVAPMFKQSSEVWIAYAHVLVDLKKWEELRAVSVQMRQLPGLGETMAGYCYYLEGRAELAMGRELSAKDSFALAVKSRLDVPALRLEAGKGLMRQHYAREARAVLLPAEKDLARDKDYWSTLLQVGIELKEASTVAQAAEALYRMEPRNPTYVNSYAASLLLLRQRPDEAIKLTFELMSTFPDSTAARINHAFSLLMNRRLEEAASLLQTLSPAALSPADRLSYNLAQFEVQMALRNPTAARTFSDQIELDDLFPSQAERVIQLRDQMPTNAPPGPTPPHAAGRG